MKTWISNLTEQRAHWTERGAHLAELTRDRGVSALETVRSGTLDWRATLEARRSELDTAAPWFRFTGLQLFFVQRAETALVGFGERVRAQIERLSQLELAAASTPPREVTQSRAPAKKKRKTKPAKAASKKKVAASAGAAKKKAARKPTAKRAAARATKKSRRFLMPIADYDTLNAKQAIAEIAELSAAERETVAAHERAHKNRKTVLAALAR